MDVKHFILSHIPWLVLVVCALVGFHYWKAEHDANVVAQITIQKDEDQVKALQQSIQQNNQIVVQLQEQMNARDAAAAKQITQLTQIVSRVQTPTQAVATLPAVVSLPEAPKVQTDDSVVFPKADVLPLFQALSEGKECSIKLAACQSDLHDSQSIASTNRDNFNKQVAITAQKDDEIKALRKKPSFWKRIGHDLKIGLVWAAGGALLVHGI